MIDPKFIPIETTESLIKISFALNASIDAYYAKINSPEMQDKIKKRKINPIPSINPFTLELQKSINDEILNRQKEEENG